MQTRDDREIVASRSSMPGARACELRVRGVCTQLVSTEVSDEQQENPSSARHRQRGGQSAGQTDAAAVCSPAHSAGRMGRTAAIGCAMRSRI